MQAETSVKISHIFELLVHASALFQARFQRPLWGRYPKYLEDPLDAILIFLEGYAFERQGRNPAYSHAAVDAIQQVRSLSKRRNFPQTVWDVFSDLLGGKKLNPRLNPLYHETTSCRCVWCVTGSENIILASREAIAKGRVRKSWGKIKRIRGLGCKIASLFLRDVAIQFGTFPASDRWLLQPIDVWVRRAVALLSGTMMKDEDIAKWLIANCEEPELANQGIWYFATQIAGSSVRLQRSIEDIDYAREILQDHIASLEAAVAATRGWYVPRC